MASRVYDTPEFRAIKRFASELGFTDTANITDIHISGDSGLITVTTRKDQSGQYRYQKHELQFKYGAYRLVSYI